jgi:DnaK suppressor protein
MMTTKKKTTATKKSTATAQKKTSQTKQVVAKKTVAKKVVKKKTVAKKAAVKKVVKKVVTQKPTIKQAAKKTVATKSTVAKSAEKTVAKKVAAKAPAKKVVAKKSIAKAPVKKSVVKAPVKPAVKKVSAIKAVSQKVAEKKVAEKKVTAKSVDKKKPVTRADNLAIKQKPKSPVVVKKAVIETIEITKVVAEPKTKDTQVKPLVEPKAKKAEAKPAIVSKATPAPQNRDVVLPKRVIHDPEVGKMPDHDTEETIDTNYMNEEERAYFRQRLQDWKIELMQEVDSTVDHLKTEDITGVADPIDRASLETDFSLELRTRDRERKLIQKIDIALDLIKHGEYGFCEDCGVAIGRKRLEARPTAMKCIDCKTFSEIKEKQGN